MYFRKIQLQQFRSHVDTTLELERLTFIRGANAAGKSSIEQAIQITLAGRADGTAADGKGSAGLIRAGQGKSLITLAVQQDGTERILRCALNGTSRSVVVTRPDDPQYSGGTDYIDSLIVHKEVLACLTNNRYFVDLDEDKQKSILARIILPKLYDWPEWVKPMVHAQMLKVDWSKTPFEIIDQAYDAAFKERTNVNRDVKNFKHPTGDASEADNLATYTDLLKTRRNELEEARRKKASLEGDSRHNAGLLQAAQERLAAANARLSREQQEIPGIEAKLLSPTKLKDLQKVAKNDTKAADLTSQIAQLEADQRVKAESMKAITKLSKEPRCPTCSTELTEEAIDAIMAPIAEAKLAIDKRYYAAIDELKALGNPAEARAQLEAHAKATTDMQRTKERIAEEQTAIRDAESKIDQLGTTAKVDTSAIDAEIETLIANIEKGTQAVQAAHTANELAKRMTEAHKENAALLKRQADLQRLVEYFGPDGVKAELLASSIGTFSDSMNWVLAQWDYTCHLSIEPYSFSIMFRDHEGLPHPIQLKHLSKSQRYRFATAFQVALAIVTGFRFVIVDEADIYDSNGRAGLFAAINSGELEQAIVMATNESEDAPDIEGAVFYRFEDTAEPGLIPTTRAEKLVPVAEEALA